MYYSTHKEQSLFHWLFSNIAEKLKKPLLLLILPSRHTKLLYIYCIMCSTIYLLCMYDEYWVDNDNILSVLHCI